jgi:uncharacterized protein (TIGR02001 family)
VGKTVAVLAAIGVLAFAGTAHADDAESGGWELSGEIGVVSDYQYRGYSLSGSDWALQGGLTVTAPSGFYASVWSSKIEEYGIGSDGDGAKFEVDLSLGRAFSAGGLDWDASYQYYGYPDGSNVDYSEFLLSASRTTGAFTATAGIQYAPSQDNLGNEDNVYLYVGGDFAPENWPVSLNAQIGHEDGAFADGKLDWQIGLAKSVGPVSLSLLYTDSDGPGAEGGVVGGITLAF